MLDLASKTHIMGIINCTPDSFFSGSRRPQAQDAVELGKCMVEEGADFLDIGGESSRPGAEPVSVEEELERVVPVVERLAQDVPVPISVDTCKWQVAEAALAAGAHLVNDISALRFSPDMARVVSAKGAGIILMHMQGKPRDMQVAPGYDDVTGEVTRFLQQQAGVAMQAGISRAQIVLDPGIGFGKRLHDNYLLIRDLAAVRETGFPVLVGASRKSMLSRVLDLPPDRCLEGTLAIHTAAILNGANILRVHDVAAARQAAQITDYFLRIRE